ncbi:MAG: hypothetical protein H6597_04920 [Flavobacteriales bacterium]|nr:hypothetical protein [Flavobacteriales bacterium]MCB9193856.1 hypothetical protein [Flavobacteriales bacterium]
MRKTVLFTAALLAASAVSAQTGEITSSKGENYLSQDGDWGLTFDAQPVLNYVGNLFNGNQNNNYQAALSWANSYWGIQGKKLVDANTAYRGMLRIGFGSNKSTELVPTADPNDDQNNTTEDVMKVGNFDLAIGVGLEKRRGSTRVVGVYGAEVFITLDTKKTTYEYGDALSTTNTQHTNTFNQGMGVTEKKDGSAFGFGLGVFGGIEWFVAPKVSLSGEYTWGLALVSQGLGETTTETWNGTSVVTTTVEGNGDSETADKTSSFTLDTGVSGFDLGINFYFQ